MLPSHDDRAAILYLAPWVDIGGSDKGTVDWFRFLDRDRFRPSLITTQPSENRRLAEVVPYADEVWDLPQLMAGPDFPGFILDFVLTRRPEVLHIMNSRLAFELLPTFASLPDRPAIVVQLHVEETDRSGYVRYVATRYGTLVDAFSVSSNALAQRLDVYEVPRARCRVIRTGVDARSEFSPARVMPAEITGVRPGVLQILFPARLSAQKDPLLMVDVAAGLRAAGRDFQLHVVGDGDLAGDVRRRVSQQGLDPHVVLHGDRFDVARWYRACDVVLLTSAFEGVPYVALEAMAMAVPVVGPRLPGLAEVVDEDVGILVEPQGRPKPYVEALLTLADDPARARALGAAGRARALGELSLERMAAEHAGLYDLVRAARAVADPEPAPATATATVSAPPAHGGLRGRVPGQTPLVSVIVPCFNHGRYLEQCLDSVAAQDYPAVEIIVVDDASTDPGTDAALQRAAARPGVTVLRQPSNRGPSAARNAALERARGRYVLPVDADNLLLPGAIASLVGQLSVAGERVGFIYPNYRFFGNRTDYFESPSYNLHALLSANYCDTSSLIDREVFDRGHRYPDVGLGHEDWDLVLQLAEAGIHGQPADTATLLYRKAAFTRSDLVDVRAEFAEVVAVSHPALFAPAARAQIKGEWSPAISIIAVDPLPAGSDDALPTLVDGAARQSCQDFEVIVRSGPELAPTALGPRLRRIPAALWPSRGEALAAALEVARGRWVLATYGSPGELLADPALVEKVLRVMNAGGAADTLALVRAQSQSPPASFALLGPPAARLAGVDAVCWPASGPLAPPAGMAVAADDPLATVIRWCSVHSRLQVRHVPRRDRGTVSASGRPDGSHRLAHLRRPRLERRRDATHRLAAPGLPSGSRRAGDPQPGTPWIPPLSRLLCRHHDPRTGGFVLTNDPHPPEGCTFQYVLGSVRSVPLAGTLSLTRADGDLGFVLGRPAEIDAPELLGYVEQAPLPLFDALRVARLLGTEQHTLVAGGQDPLAGAVDLETPIGFIEAHPVHPRTIPHIDPELGLIGLVRTVDLAARRHRYGAGHAPAGRLAGELGALLDAPAGDCVPMWIDAAGRVSTPAMAPLPAPLSAGAVARWAVEPLTWSGFSAAGPKLRAAVRRVSDGVILGARSARPARPGHGLARPAGPAGYLLAEAGGRTVELLAAVHPVTGDQLLSTSERELADMGYGQAMSLGYLSASAPVTGRLGTLRVAVPWARRFGVA